MAFCRFIVSTLTCGCIAKPIAARPPCCAQKASAAGWPQLCAEAVRYNYPSVNGYRLDWCLTFAHNCGQPAADAFCAQHGGRAAIGFGMQPQVSVETMNLQNAICDPKVNRCDSFTYIDCPVHIFPDPIWNGMKLDWCLEFESECGQPAAQEFCSKSGFANLQGYAKLPRISSSSMCIGDNAICQASVHTCDSFSYVSCY